MKNTIFQENHVKNTKNTAYSHVIVTVTLKYRVNCVINPVENIKILCGNNQHGLFVFAAPAVLCFVQCNVIIPRSHIVGGMSSRHRVRKEKGQTRLTRQRDWPHSTDSTCLVSLLLKEWRRQFRHYGQAFGTHYVSLTSVCGRLNQALVRDRVCAFARKCKSLVLASWSRFSVLLQNAGENQSISSW